MIFTMARFTVIFLTLLFLACSHRAAGKGLHLKSYSEDEVKGCYDHDQTLGVCFDVKKDFIRIQKTTGEGLMHYEKLGRDVFLYQVSDKAFIGHGPSMFYAPNEVPRDPEVLRSFLNDIFEDEMEKNKELKNHYQEAMSELHYAPEVKLLERLSAALSDNATQLAILQPFHVLCFNLLKQLDVEIPFELRAAPGVEYETADQYDQEKRCSQPRRNHCRGMCGKKCSCWRWFCGDCCWHRGCYEHDLCCNYNFYSSYCLTPIGLTCSRYPGYPACKPKPIRWWG